VTAFENIKHYYKPIQPAVKAENEKITYREVPPPPALINFVYCYWQLKTQRDLKEPFTYRVVSDGCIDLFFNHHQPTENFVMGFCRKYTEFHIGTSFDYIGIRFLPAAFPLMFGINAKTLSNQSQELEHIFPAFSTWMATKLTSEQSFEKITLLVSEKLVDFTANKEFQFDQRFYNALNLIFQKHGLLNTEKELNTGLSPRQLRRIFNFHIGTTAKAFSNVVRFQHILNANPDGQHLKVNKLYFDVGFYDQAHFIKNFKTFYGITPSEAFR